MSRLDKINWNQKSTQLLNEIRTCPLEARRDLQKLWDNLSIVAKEVSKLEVVERRTMGSSGRSADEKLAELEKQIKYLEKMTTIARLSF